MLSKAAGFQFLLIRFFSNNQSIVFRAFVLGVLSK